MMPKHPRHAADLRGVLAYVHNAVAVPPGVAVSAFHQTQHLLCQRYTVRSVLRQQRDLEIRLAHIVGKSGQAGQRRRHLRSDLAVVAVSALAFGYADDREIRSASAHRELHRHAQYVVGSKQCLCSRESTVTTRRAAS
ncbi:MAG: hypothetical protein ACLR7U_09115 [Ruthenibacterium lactatiformans]